MLPLKHSFSPTQHCQICFRSFFTLTFFSIHASLHSFVGINKTAINLVIIVRLLYGVWAPFILALQYQAFVWLMFFSRIRKLFSIFSSILFHHLFGSFDSVNAMIMLLSSSIVKCLIDKILCFPMVCIDCVSMNEWLWMRVCGVCGMLYQIFIWELFPFYSSELRVKLASIYWIIYEMNQYYGETLIFVVVVGWIAVAMFDK